MRQSLTPSRATGLRVAVVLIAAATLVALAGIASATIDKAPRKASLSPAPAITQREFKKQLATRLAQYRDLDAALRRPVFIAKGGSSRKWITEHIVMGGAVDGNYLYWPRLTLKLRPGHDIDQSGGFSTTVFRTNIATGKDEKLLVKKGALVFAIHAAGGRVALQSLRTLQLGGESFAKLTLYTAGADDPALTVSNVSTIPDDDLHPGCRSFETLSGISPAGDPIITNYRQTCPDNSDPLIEAEFVRVAVGGDRQSLGPAPLDSMFFAAPVKLNGSKLVAGDPFNYATAVRDLSSGSLTDLWSRPAWAVDVSGDGTVALLGAPKTLVSEFDFIMPGQGGRSPKPKYPLVLFPGGDADHPKLISASKAKLESLKFCGDHLFAIVGTTTLRAAFAALSAEFQAIYFLMPQLATQEHHVDVYDMQGNYLRTAAKLSPVGIAAVGCNGANLMVGVVHGKKVRATEVTP